MASNIIFYDPDGHHDPTPEDSDILFLKSLQNLYQTVSTNNHTRPIVCLCCQNSSTIIDELQQRQPNVLIYLCTNINHYGPPDPEIVNGNVRSNVVFSLDGDWKFKIVLNRIQSAGINGSKEEILSDTKILKKIVDKSFFESRSSIEEEDPNASSKTPDEDFQSEEAQEKEH